MRLLHRLARRGAHLVIGQRRARQAALLARDVKRRLEYWTLPDGRRSIQILADYRDRYRGERCVIIGNGPSLREMNLEPLRDEFTFALNRGYLLFKRLGFPMSFLVAVNRYVIEQCAHEIVGASVPTFVSWHARRHVPTGATPTYLCSISSPGFYGDVRNGLWEGTTVTYVALQLAYHMGFTDVVLIGVDHSFATAGKPHELVTSNGDDPNHFDATYFGKGFRWQLPDLATSEVAYRLALQAFAGDGRRVVDATVGGKLDVFPKANFVDLFPVAAARARLAGE